VNTTVDASATCSAQQITAVYVKGKLLLERNKYRDAVVMFRLMAYLAPRDERAWLGLGLCHEGQGQMLVARELYLIGGAAANSAKCHLACARLLAKQGARDQALLQFERAIALAEEGGDDTLLGLATKERALCHGN
jgi:tetratricopeptide (TPR) repeat protein